MNLEKRGKYIRQKVKTITNGGKGIFGFIKRWPGDKLLTPDRHSIMPEVGSWEES